MPLAHASEVDNFTVRTGSDSREWLNKKMNSVLKQAAEEANQNSWACDIQQLHRRLYAHMGRTSNIPAFGFVWAGIEKWSVKNPNSFRIPMERSIYSDSMKVRGNGVRVVSPFTWFYTEGNFKFDSAIVGDDKLGHFFQIGYAIYRAEKKKQDPAFRDIRLFDEKYFDFVNGIYKFLDTTPLRGEALVLAYSHHQEDLGWGYEGTHVRSYADIMANFEGYHFWTEVTEGENPYFTCVRGAWKKTRAFDWSLYISDGWDEAVNCSDFDKKIEKKVNANILKRGHGPCPVNPASCVQLAKRYEKWASSLLHPRCLKAAF